MKPPFADTFYFLAFLDRRDAHHRRAFEFASTHRGTVVTTRWVLTELANGLSGSPLRASAARFLQRIESDRSFLIVNDSDDLYNRGLALFADRADKAWSLTDCISFEVMTMMGLSEALTGDRHFEQAGFRALLI